MSKPLDKVLDACARLGLPVATVANWNRCPHPCSPDGDSKHRSFAFRECPDGTVIFKSHKPSYTSADCLKALVLEWRDLFPETDSRYARDPDKICGYEYTDVNGRPVGRVTRTKDKEFLQGRYDRAGKFIPRLDGEKLPLFFAAFVQAWVKEGPVYVVEGEKDALSLIRAKQPATSKPGGCKSGWEEQHVALLKGADIVIVADKDAPGYTAAQDAYLALYRAAKSVRIVEARNGKDATDHLESGFTVAEFVPRDDLAENIPVYALNGKVVTCVDVEDVADAPAVDGVPTGFMGIDRGSEAKGLPKGQMTVWAARKKVGKTSGMCQIAAYACESFYRVLYVTLADLQPSQLWRRMRRQQTGWADAPQTLELNATWQADIDRIRKFWELKFADAGQIGGRDVEDVVAGVEALHERYEFDLVIVDYAQKLTSGKEKDRVRAMEHVSSELAFMADRQKFAVLLGSQVTEDGRTRYSQEFEDDCGLMVVVSAPEGLESCQRRFDVPYSRFGPSFGFDAGWDKSRLVFTE